MPKYIFIYKGPATGMSDMTEEQSKLIMDEWRKWITKLGDSLIDVGQPMANGVSLIDNHKIGEASLLNGYSIVKAPTMEKAKEFATGHPFLSEGKGAFAIDIFELIDISM